MVFINFLNLVFIYLTRFIKKETALGSRDVYHITLSILNILYFEVACFSIFN